MAKRFSDSDRWKKQAWLKNLTPYYKLAWVYIGDECDHAGIWKIDVVDLMEYTGIPEFDIYDFVDTVNNDYNKITGEKIVRERLRIIDDKYLWITGFIQFQYSGKGGKVSMNTVTKSALNILESRSLLNEAIEKGFINPSEPYGTPSRGSEGNKDKDRDKDNKDSSEKKSNKFQPPTVEECSEYLQESHGLSESVADRIADIFWSFYESKGWMVGKNKMKKWKISLGQAKNWDNCQEIIKNNSGTNRPYRKIR